jgi:hypothetical protein
VSDEPFELRAGNIGERWQRGKALDEGGVGHGQTLYPALGPEP